MHARTRATNNMSTMNHPLPAFLASASCVLAVACHDSGPAASAPPAAGDCPPSWLDPPPVEPAIAAPLGTVHVVLHAKASGTQNYTCAQTGADAGSVAAPGYAWKFAGPEASLADCRGAPLGRHFASEAGASAPQWQTDDGAFIVGHKVAASTPDGGAPAVPWLLLTTERAGGAGPLREATYVQRIDTAGGVAPTIACDASNAGVTRKVPYTADYYFYAPSR
jgi:Protein of unknown function (DUF3455)